MSNNLPLYNVSDYTDVELYNILDLVNPTDRELEAKILMQIHKYENIRTKSAQKLARFFDDIYNHFFETEEDEEAVEGYANQGETFDEYIGDASKKYQLKTDNDPSGPRQVNREPQSVIDANIAAATNAPDPTKSKVGSSNNMVSMTEKSEPETKTVGYTQNLEYTKGKLNPILQQTTKRVISIDSQYRSDKRTMSTAFTFNLSEPLKDVVSLKLYSVQIPYTWYTIGKAYGNNFFFFKGRTPGIDTDYHDLKIEIEPGNYSPKDLIDTVNGSITKLKASAIDASMGLTLFSYNKYTSICTLYANISKSYNESSYYIEFPAWSSPYSTNNTQTIPAFFGLQTDKYYSNKLKSISYYNLIDSSYNDISGNASTSSFIVNNSNNYFTIALYKQTYTNQIDNSFNITLTNGTYTRKELILHVNTRLTAETRLVNSSLLWKNIDSRNDYANNVLSKKSYVELTINLVRTINSNIVNDNPKIQVVFPDVSQESSTNGNVNIWVNTLGDNSCFGFHKLINNLDDIIGEISPVYQSYSYPITTKPYIQLKTNISYFNNARNDISFNITNSTDVDGYNLYEYIDEINASIRRFDASNNNICKSPPVSYSFVPTIQNPYPIGTYAYMQNDKFNLYLDINKTYDERYYEIELGGGVFDPVNGIFKFRDQYDVAYTKLTDLTKTYTSTYNAAGIVIDINQLIFKIKPKNSGSIVNGNENDVTYELRFPNTTVVNYSGYIEFKDALHTIFTNYKDPISNLPIFENLLFTETIGSNSYIISFNPKINKKLIAKNYNIQFVDLSVELGGTNGWSDNLNVYRTMANSQANGTIPYDMSHNLPLTGQYTTLYDDNSNIIFSMDSVGKVNITGYTALLAEKTITITSGINDTINIIAYEEGVYTATQQNNISISVGPGIYSRDSLINTINTAIQNVVSSTTNCASTLFDITPINNKNFLKINANITRNYKTTDFDVVFFDNESFATCTSGASSVQNTTWDTTVGWIMGFREYTLYDMSAPGVISNSISNVITIMGDTGLSTNLYNYFLICLDDFNQNRLNDGLVTITNVDTSIPLPSYASRSDFVCDPVTGQKIYSASSGLTEKQIYAAQAIANSGTSTESIGSSVSTKSYGSGPFVTDVFGLIPMKVSGLENGSTYVEFGGTLQNQQRNYFGPVNIHRMSVRLVTDRGNLVDLNKANWSFSLVCEQLNKLDPTSSN
jgi:hypothetical protein